MAAQAMAMESRWEWMTACDVQQRFMQRQAAPAGALDHDARCRQMLEVGGDCFDFIPLAGNRTGIAIGDASGKGLAAALMISSVQSSLRTAALFGGDPAAVMDVVNRQVHAASPSERYATLFYGVYDAATRTLRYVNAGHVPPMVLRRDGSVECLWTGGAPVGMFDDSTYDEGAVRLAPGDLLIACSDGITEAANDADEQWGANGVRRAAAANRAKPAHAIVDAIFRAMDEFTAGDQTDDATVLVFRAK
ncbi:MAG TPA: PP2C family protein-serine/threonine phosphatase [Bryobacteraceae bacterium]|jgi:sigma-B regulation protein RsbU (phosphoserine phosphatase)|nr:PP2C family protein-serine/threonine phosphatase [Bryobacteraceae bacterium]